MRIRKAMMLSGCCLFLFAFSNQSWAQDFRFNWCGELATCGSCSRQTTLFQVASKSKEVPSASNNWLVPTSHRKDSQCAGRTAEPIPAARPELSLPKLDGESAMSGQTQTQPQTAATHDAGDLATKLANPVASLISVPFQSNFDFGMGSGSGWRYSMNLQPVIPIRLNSKWNLISRTILPIIHQSNVVSQGTSESGLGDITQSIFFSPAEPKRFVWAVGPVILIPTATNDFLGTEKFGIGPTFLILKQQHGWTYGALTNHVWSVAGSDSRADVNSTFLQPFLSYNTKDGWTYAVNTESSYDWTGNHWSVPIHLTISKLVKFGKHPVSFGGGMRCWATSPQGGPQGCGLRMIVTPLFPR